MKLLSISLGFHDSNICYYDGNDVQYFKSERFTQIKHHTIRSIDEVNYLIRKVWGIGLHDVDQICLCGTTDSDIIPVVDNVHVIPHHWAHALSAMPFIPKPGVSIVIDGQGGSNTWVVYRGGTVVAEGIVAKHGSIGHGLMWMGQALGIQGSKLDSVGKLMGLQSYGNIDAQYLSKLQAYDENNVGAHHIKPNKTDPPTLMPGNTLFSLDNYKQFKGTTDVVLLDWAKTVHHRCGEIILGIFKKYVGENEVVSYSGGVAQNVIWNTELKKHFKNLEILPHVGDEGLSIGGMEYLRELNNLPKLTYNNFPFSQSDQSTNIPSDQTIQTAAKLLSQGKIVAWYQGHGEVGPRALGNRSIFFDPRIPNGKDIVNTVKNREYYRPFGASVLSEFKKEYFDLDFENPYMLYVGMCQKEYLKSITHIDGTCRVQTVNSGVFRRLLEEFYNLTGCPVLLNTSLNNAGKPIAGEFSHGMVEFNNRNIDVFIHGDKIYEKDSIDNTDEPGSNL
jgi:carbamoyltransferase